MKFLLSIASSVITDKPKAVVTDQTDDGVFVAFDTEIARLTNIQAAEAAQILRTSIPTLHSHHSVFNRWMTMPGDKIEASNIPPGDNGTRAELGETR
ncbi:hypothetical protein F2Q69_00058714 [Brassica cretica]|uniref:Uncharacterized protein n=1 Tax=Brassica cretica TaxID=69181 RepID=A0A8S9RBM7_BRACR|nr:hypothetical protein F2Q69_00058714 [Brassica cretica]